jgi:hypothetical protein
LKSKETPHTPEMSENVMQDTIQDQPLPQCVPVRFGIAATRESLDEVPGEFCAQEGVNAARQLFGTMQTNQGMGDQGG